MTLQEKLGKAIVRLRKQNDITQEELATKADIDRKYMSDIENGKRNISIDIIERLAKSFHMSVSYLFAEAEEIGGNERTVQDLKKALCYKDCEDSIVLEHPDFLSAVSGITEDGRVIYSYEKMITWMMIHDDMDAEEAAECISYDTIPSLSYAGEKAPIIMFDLDY